MTAFRASLFPVIIILGVMTLFPRISHAGCRQTRLPNLRDQRYIGVTAHFQVARTAVEGIVADFKRENPGIDDADITIPESTLHSEDGTPTGTIGIYYVLEKETYYDVALNKSAETYQRVVHVATPVQIEGSRGFIVVAQIIEGLPMASAIVHFTHSGVAYLAESIDHTWNCSEQIVTFTTKDGSTFQIATEYDSLCHHKVSGEADAAMPPTRILTAHGSFDWGCHGPAANRGYCQELEEHNEDIQAAGGNVCAELSSTYVRSCNATVRLLGMTGKFKEMMPYLAAIAPDAGLEPHFIDEERTAGVIYPCMA